MLAALRAPRSRRRVWRSSVKDQEFSRSTVTLPNPGGASDGCRHDAGQRLRSLPPRRAHGREALRKQRSLAARCGSRALRSRSQTRPMSVQGRKRDLLRLRGPRAWPRSRRIAGVQLTSRVGRRGSNGCLAATRHRWSATNRPRSSVSNDRRCADVRRERRPPNDHERDRVTRTRANYASLATSLEPVGVARRSAAPALPDDRPPWRCPAIGRPGVARRCRPGAPPPIDGAMEPDACPFPFRSKVRRRVRNGVLACSRSAELTVAGQRRSCTGLPRCRSMATRPPRILTDALR